MNDAAPNRLHCGVHAMLAGADYKLATAVRLLREAGYADLSDEANELFRAALALRHKYEARTIELDEGPPERLPHIAKLSRPA